MRTQALEGFGLDCLRKTVLLQGESWFFYENHLLRGKTKKNIFFREWGWDFEEDVFFGFAS